MVDTPAARFPLAEHPRLRPIEIFPVQDGGQRLLVLRDPADPALRPLVVAGGAGEILMLLNGRRTVSEVGRALSLRGATLSHTQLQQFLVRLDEAGFLEGPRAEHRFSERVARFRAAPLRAAVHAGGAYAGTPEDLRRMLADGYVHADGPGAQPGAVDPTVAPPKAIVAPHVDLHRGAPTYSWAYKALGEAAPADLYVVLGTCHTPVAGGFAGLNKAYDTPFGPVALDADFQARLGRLWGRDLFEGEFSHSGEHSIEFQAVYLRSLERGPMVGVLCDSLHSMVPPGKSPRDVGLVSDFVDAVRSAAAEDGRRITFVAAVDLAHVGRRFGDSWLVDAGHRRDIEQGDRELLAHLVAADAEGYYAHVMRDRDARRICGFTPLYVLARLMEGQSGEVLKYTQWVDTDGSSSVTFASCVFR